MNKIKNNQNIIIGLLLIGLFVLLKTPSCLAINSIVDTSGNYATGDYTLNDIRNYAVYLMELILSLVGSLSLIAFIYGGVTFLLSAGSSEKVKKGMDIIKAAVVGLIITFASVLIINLFLGGLGASWSTQTGIIQEKTTTNKTSTKLNCATSFGSQGYSCMQESNGKNCKVNYCPDQANSIKCCQAK